MLYFDRIDISEGRIEGLKRSNSKEYMICNYRCFNHRFKFQDCVCNDCHNLMSQYLML